jgi:formate-dependent nitrite reductase cytochrome c552 subunit
MNVGGGKAGGIHGAHMGPGVQIRYAASDKKRQTIPWIEYRNTETGVSRTYLASGAKPGAETRPPFEMQCVDCHNRAAHSFETAEHALDQAIAHGTISASLPFVRKTGLALLQTEFRSDEEAEPEIPSRLAAFYSAKYPEVFTARKADIEAAGKALAAIYSHNVFPDLKVTWGTYASNLGHNDSPGCFRCHDDAHATADKKTITQDCGTCHRMLATEETEPAILKTLGLGDKITSVPKQ